MLKIKNCRKAVIFGQIIVKLSKFDLPIHFFFFLTGSKLTIRAFIYLPISSCCKSEYLRICFNTDQQYYTINEYVKTIFHENQPR